MRLIANIDIKNEYVIKGIQLEGLRKIDLPIKIIKKFYDNGIHEILIHDSVASYYKRNNLGSLIKDCFKKIFVPVIIGGGMRSIKDIKAALNYGADKVMINTEAIKNPKFLKKACDEYGSSTIVSYIEVKKNKDTWDVYFNNGREKSSFFLDEWIEIVQKMGCGEILIKSIDRDGTMSGLDYELIRRCHKLINRPIIFAGGCSSQKEILSFKKEFDNSALAFASIFYNTNLNLRSIINLVNE
jgi:cyclase